MIIIMMRKRNKKTGQEYFIYIIYKCIILCYHGNMAGIFYKVQSFPPCILHFDKITQKKFLPCNVQSKLSFLFLANTSPF